MHYAVRSCSASSPEKLYSYRSFFGFVAAESISFKLKFIKVKSNEEKLNQIFVYC